MSVPTIPPPTAPAARSASGRSPRQSYAFWIAIILLAGAIFGPFAYVQIPREIGRWQLAAALNLRTKGDKDGAYDRLASAIGWFSDSPELHLQRAEWRLEDGQRDDALADADKMLEPQQDSYQWLVVHSLFLQNAGEFARAVDDWKKIDRFSERSGIPSRETAKNGLAYAQALAKVDLDEALKHVNDALRFAPQNAAMLDTRGFILHLLDQNDEAIADLDQAVQGMSDRLSELLKDKNSGEGLPTAVAEVRRLYPQTLLELAETDTNAARSIAVMHYHRALVLSALGRQTEAEADRAIVRKLIGREGDESLF